MVTIPPFPSQDLAKLVLGYLAEEQLMTAYDEFLQASPYLDAYQNEFDRIFMTSLKNILAEYRAVKIYVETCKPYSLRKRLFGCANLLETVKFLIENVDISKLPPQQPSRTSLDIRNSSDRSSLCAVCASLKLNKCVCRNRKSFHDTHAQSSQHLWETTQASSVEATSLKDLPGNNVITKKKLLKTLSRDSMVSESSSYGFVDSNNTGDSVVCVNTLPNTATLQSCHQRTLQVENYNVINSPVQRIDEENILTHRLPSNKVSVAGTFQDFSEGVRGNEITNSNVPDSSTSENTNLQMNCQNLNTPLVGSKNSKNAKTLSKAHIYLTVGSVKTKASHTVPPMERSSTDSQTNVGSRATEQKVTILSDIKVDNSVASDKTNMPPVLKNATSTPLMQMQTILINGTPAYKQQLPHSYTKDEIMAMPTIIVVPKSGASQIPVPYQSQPQTTNTITSSVHSYAPLVIDVAPHTIEKPNTDTVSNMPILNPPQESENGLLVKTVENKNVSVPKDHTDIGIRSTPQVLPLTRKSSSTPRRTSHVRVLDFTTPRRILTEHIAESAAENSESPVEVIVSRSPNLHTFASSVSGDNGSLTVVDDPKINRNNPNNTNSSKENDSSVKVISCKKARNWDAELRALAVPNRMEDMENIESCIKTCKPRPKNIKKTTGGAKNNNNTESNGPNKTQPKKTNKIKKGKKKTEEPIEESKGIEDSSNVPVKPTINLITSSEWSSQEPNKSQNKSNNEELTDTPEMDRTSLQNAMGAKLNITDLLETPYKQAIYDIQMETPKFLGTDLPDEEPLSSIKILSMPTPMFLQTPKPALATPSSYSSRLTDYSSGGSYYKPDDQDYLPVDLEYPTKPPKDKLLTELVKTTDAEKNMKQKPDFKSSRPVRKCTKNVSYRDIISNKTRDCSEKLEEMSSCSESMNDSLENKNEKIMKDDQPKKIKPDGKKKNPIKSSSKKRKTPVKKDSQKSFLKIKPRRITPIKVNLSGKGKKKTPERLGKKSVATKELKNMQPPAVESAPTKSRRKSSTPRKINCTKTFNSESSGHESPEITPKHTQDIEKESVMQGADIQDSDSENIPLRYSDDGSQDGKSKEAQENEIEDISKIKEYIASEILHFPKVVASNDIGGNFQVDLVRRGFDIETAKIIERDLLDPPSVPNASCASKFNPIDNPLKDDEVPLERTINSDTSCSLKIVQEEENDEDMEFSVSECIEESENYITCYHDETKDSTPAEDIKFKDKFCMEVCIDEAVTVRLRATSLKTLFELDSNLPQNQKNQDTDEPQYDQLETEMAVNSISNMEKLYTPMKDSIRAQVYEIFDSTLTSIDTPLKADSPKRKECDTTVTEIVLEVEKIEEKEKPESKKRKRMDSVDSVESTGETKRSKPEAQLFGSMSTAKIQSFDIESVLCKLHGP